MEPAIGIGHVSIRVRDLAAAVKFYSAIGLEHVPHGGSLEIMKLRGGAHLLLFQARGAPRKGPIKSFDLAVEDLEAHRDRLVAAGIECSQLRKDRWSDHRVFQVTDPDGHALTFISGHGEDDEVGHALPAREE